MSGGICAGRRRYRAALGRLQAVLTAPTMVVNAITLAAYKKWLLLSLICHGKACLSNQLPKLEIL